MTGTFGEVFGPRNHTGSEPRPACKQVAKIAIIFRGSNRVKWGTKLCSRSPDHIDILINPFLYDK